MAKTGTYGIDINQFSGEITVGGTISVSRAGELKRILEYNFFQELKEPRIFPSFGVGYDALNSIDDKDIGRSCTAFGTYALKHLVSGDNNTAFGNRAGYGFTTGNSNTCFGSYTGGYQETNNEGYGNTYVGSTIAAFSTGGNENVGVGQGALYYLTTGSYNMAVGRASLQEVTTGENNVAIGRLSGRLVTDGSNNTFVGANLNAGGNVSDTLVVGAGSRKDVFANADGIVLGDGVLGTEVFNLVISNYASLDFPDDATAAANGIALGGVYHTGGAIKVRLS